MHRTQHLTTFCGKSSVLRAAKRLKSARICIALGMSLTVLTTGCLSPLAKHSHALAAATAPVVEQAGAAYASANTIHFMRTDYDAIALFDAGSPVYNPRTIAPLMTFKEIQVRLAVLAAFQLYVKSLVAITSGTDSPELQAAATSAGTNLASVGNTLAPAVESIFGIASADSTATTPADPITPTIQNATSTAIDALGQFLINRKVKKELPHIIESMDPRVKVLCDLLQSDISILKGIEDRDYNSVVNRQTLFLREPSSKLNEAEHRALIMQLPAMVRRQQESDQRLTVLSAAIARLELTHHALAAEAQGNNPASLNQKFAELEAAGADLGKFYSSLSQ